MRPLAWPFAIAGNRFRSLVCLGKDDPDVALVLSRTNTQAACSIGIPLGTAGNWSHTELVSLKAIITIVLGFALAFAAGLVSNCEPTSFWVNVALRGRRVRLWYRAKAQSDHPASINTPCARAKSRNAISRRLPPRGGSCAP